MEIRRRVGIFKNSFGKEEFQQRKKRHLSERHLIHDDNRQQSPKASNLVRFDKLFKDFAIRDIRKVRKRQHRKPEFGHKQGEIHKNPAK
jgi:hypothetical protein